MTFKEVVYSDFVIYLSSVILIQILKSVSFLAILVFSMKYTVKKSTIHFFKTQLGRLSLTLNHFCICFDDKNSKTIKINQLKLNIFVNKNKSKKLDELVVVVDKMFLSDFLLFSVAHAQTVFDLIGDVKCDHLSTQDVGQTQIKGLNRMSRNKFATTIKLFITVSLSFYFSKALF